MNEHREEKITYAAILKILGLLVVFFLLVMAASYLTLRVFRAKGAATEILQAMPQAPLLESASSAALSRLRKEETVILNSYGWEDRENGMIRIPIERAIDIMAESNSLNQPVVPPSQQAPVNEPQPSDGGEEWWE